MLKKFLSSMAFVVFIIFWIEILVKTEHFFLTRTIFGTDYTKFGIFFFACILAPIVEELIFRKVPMDFARKYNKANGQDYTIPIAVMSSWIFANGHNNAPYNELLQGFAGFLLCLLYIRNNYSYWFNVIAHAGWNISVFYLLPFIEKIW